MPVKRGFHFRRTGTHQDSQGVERNAPGMMVAAQDRRPTAIAKQLYHYPCCPVHQRRDQERLGTVGILSYESTMLAHSYHFPPLFDILPVRTSYVFVPRPWTAGLRHHNDTRRLGPLDIASISDGDESVWRGVASCVRPSPPRHSTRVPLQTRRANCPPSQDIPNRILGQTQNRKSRTTRA